MKTSENKINYNKVRDKKPKANLIVNDIITISYNKHKPLIISFDQTTDIQTTDLNLICTPLDLSLNKNKKLRTN